MGFNEHIVFLVGVELVEGEIRVGADDPLKPDTKFILIVRIIVVYGTGFLLSVSMHWCKRKRRPFCKIQRVKVVIKIDQINAVERPG